jgi:farnesyl-diphosphate farnesyltransferase
MEPFVSEHLLGVSRTYALVVPMLPAPLDEAVGIAYLLMRIVDTIEDDPELSQAERGELFAQLEAGLGGDEAAARELARPLGELPAEQALMRAAPEVLRRVAALEPAYREAVRTCARTMATGVQRLMARANERGEAYPAVHDLRELREYCYYVAGDVGEMLCDMMSHYLQRPQWRERRGQAVELGTGLQLVNILKDALQDARHGRRYLPITGRDEADAARIIAEALGEARRCLRIGVDYVLGLPGRPTGLRSFCGLPIVWGGLTLAEGERGAAAAKIGRDAIGASVARFAEVVEDEARLRAWLREVLQPVDTGAPTHAHDPA